MFLGKKKKILYLNYWHWLSRPEARTQPDRWEGIFPTGRAGKWGMIFSTGRAGTWGVIFPMGRTWLGNERGFFQRAGPGRQMRDDFFLRAGTWGVIFPTGRAGTWEMIFRTGRAGTAKRELNFLIAGSGYKKRKTNNITSQFGLRKQRRSFETDR